MTLQKPLSKTILITIGLVIVSFGVYALYKQQKYYKETVPTAIDINQALPGSSISDELIPGSLSSTAELMEEEIALPSELNLKMAFYSQAPFGNWDYPWQEACEEASALLVANAYFNHDWSREEFNEQILQLVEWEKGHFGQYEHTSAQETLEILEHLGLKGVIHYDPGLDVIKRILSRRNFIIVPLAGKILANPYYTNGGPVYHMLVVKGYKDNKIITNDVGTRHGENYVYAWDRFHQAMHDYAEPIERGPKVIIEVLKPVSKQYENK